MKTENTISQMRKGVLELCLLAIISRKPSYVSDLLEELKQAQLLVVEGTLYPLLTRLKNSGFLSYHWEESRSGPPRKYYKLSEEGETLLAEMKESWNELALSVNGLINQQ